jgi:hypothetical protein
VEQNKYEKLIVSGQNLNGSFTNFKSQKEGLNTLQRVQL